MIIRVLPVLPSRNLPPVHVIEFQAHIGSPPYCGHDQIIPNTQRKYKEKTTTITVHGVVYF